MIDPVLQSAAQQVRKVLEGTLGAPDVRAFFDEPNLLSGA